jgi:hypothetical protein
LHVQWGLLRRKDQIRVLPSLSKSGELSIKSSYGSACLGAVELERKIYIVNLPCVRGKKRHAKSG